MTETISTNGASSPTIVIVDDDVVLQGLFTLILGSLGYNILTGCNGREGVQHLRKNDVSLLVTDLVMPNQEGLETIIGVRREFPKLKILVVSGYSEYFRTAILCGACDCLLKPVDPNILQKRVMEIVQPERSLSAV
jgi:YesN/AraC family two-component response regulator